MRSAFALVVSLFVLAACETGPHERIVRSQFACDDGRRLRVAFNLDQGAAEVRVDRSKEKPVLISRQEGVPGRAYASGGYSLSGVGDQITYATPTTPGARCVETR